MTRIEWIFKIRNETIFVYTTNFNKNSALVELGKARGMMGVTSATILKKIRSLNPHLIKVHPSELSSSLTRGGSF